MHLRHSNNRKSNEKQTKQKNQLIIIHETPLLILATHIFSLFFLSFIYEFPFKIKAHQVTYFAIISRYIHMHTYVNNIVAKCIHKLYTRFIVTRLTRFFFSIKYERYFN